MRIAEVIIPGGQLKTADLNKYGRGGSKRGPPRCEVRGLAGDPNDGAVLLRCVAAASPVSFRLFGHGVPAQAAQISTP